jgi:hypothetical protein
MKRVYKKTGELVIEAQEMSHLWQIYRFSDSFFDHLCNTLSSDDLNFHLKRAKRYGYSIQ